MLHWLKIDYRIQYKVAVLVFKYVHGLAPPYLSELIDMSHNRQLRLALSHKLQVAKADTALVHNSSFTSMGPQIWNALPTSIRTTTLLDTFKTKLKTYLFNICYNDLKKNLLSTILNYY